MGNIEYYKRMKSFAFACLASAITAANIPVAVFHGLGDDCLNPGMHQFTKEIGEKTGNVYSKCIKIGAAGGMIDSIFENF